MAQFPEQRQVLLLAGIELRVVDRAADLVALGDIHRDVGIAHQRLRIGRMIGKECNADAGAHVERLILEVDRSLQRRDDALCQLDHLCSLHRRHQQREFVAPQARHTAGAAHERAQAHADLAQHVIADAVAERVIDELEPVQIHHQDRERFPARLRLGDAALESFAKLRAVRQLRQRVLVRQLQDALLAFGNARAHVIQTLRKRADLVVALHLHRRGVVAVANAPDRSQQKFNRTGDAQRDDHAAGDRQRQAQNAQHDQRRAQGAKARHRVGDRSLQHRDDMLAGGGAERHEANLRLALRHLQQPGVERLGVCRQLPGQRGAGGHGQGRSQQFPATAALDRERHVEAGQLTQIPGECAIDRVAVDDPADRHRRADRHRDQLKRVLIEHSNRARLAVGSRRVDQCAEFEAAWRAARSQRVGDHLALEVHVQHRLGLDALALIVERGSECGDIPGGHRLAKRKIGRRRAGRLRLALGVLPQHPRKHFLADA